MAVILQTHVHHMEGLHKHPAHDEEHGHEHEHDENGQLHGHCNDVQGENDCDGHDHGDEVNLTEVHVQKRGKMKKAVKWVKSHLKHNHSHSHSENINVRAALIHCVGDIVQSIGVIIAAYIIRFKASRLMTS